MACGNGGLCDTTVVCARTFTNVLRNPYLLALNYGATIVIGVVAGLIFNNLPYARGLAVCIARIAGGLTVCCCVTQNFNGLQDRLGIFFFAFLLFAMTSLSSLGICTSQCVAVCVRC